MSVCTVEAIIERIKAGTAAARANGKHVGQRRNQKRLSEIRRLRGARWTVIQIADLLKCSRQAVYQALAKTAHID
jgi:DNA invertase Pin-like site-specific DNA recombinase